MAWLSDKNKNLKVKTGVILTPQIDKRIAELDPFFEGNPSWVTSGLRDAYSQLRIVRNFLTKKGLAKQYPRVMDVNLRPDELEYDGVLGHKIYIWQWAWSHLLNIKVIINPPLAAEVLMDYFGPTGKGSNKKGQVLNQTPHAKGTEFNIGGGGNPQDEFDIVEKAKAAGIKVDPLLERDNDAVHVHTW